MVNMITALCGYFSGTFVSDTGGTFVSDIGGTFEVILSPVHTNLAIPHKKNICVRPIITIWSEALNIICG